MSAEATSLARLSVLVTRPEQQAAGFCKSLQLAGASTARLPTIEIVFPPLPADPQRLAQYKLLIFTSANAVNGAIRQWPRAWRSAEVLVAAIGPATAKALEDKGIRVDITPVKHNSEGMLKALSTIDLRGFDVAILRGDSGRNLLIEQLTPRAASVSHLELYQRRIPKLAQSDIEKAVQQTNVSCVSSDLGLQNLAKLLTPAQLSVVRSRPLIVNSSRCADLAKALGFSEKISVAIPPGDTGQLQALRECAESTPAG